MPKLQRLCTQPSPRREHKPRVRYWPPDSHRTGHFISIRHFSSPVDWLDDTSAGLSLGLPIRRSSIAAARQTARQPTFSRCVGSVQQAVPCDKAPHGCTSQGFESFCPHREQPRACRLLQPAPNQAVTSSSLYFQPSACSAVAVGSVQQHSHQGTQHCTQPYRSHPLLTQGPSRKALSCPAHTRAKTRFTLKIGPLPPRADWRSECLNSSKHVWPGDDITIWPNR